MKIVTLAIIGAGSRGLDRFSRRAESACDSEWI